MQISNPIQMNDWEFNKFLKAVLAIQLTMWCVIGLEAMNIHIPIIRQFIGFIYLTFVPGILILRIIKLHKLGNIETLLYSVGLSISILMFTGLFMNTIYPIFGISGPISITPLIITISMIVLVLCVLSYVMDKDYSDPGYIDVKGLLSNQALFLCLLPFLSVLGAYLTHYHDTNSLLIILLAFIALIPILVAFDKIPIKLYPLAVFVISLSLLYHNSLSSPFIFGRDIHVEYYFSNLVLINSHWDAATPSSVNAMLSTVIFSPIYSIICNMSLTGVFKIICPLIYSLAPLGLYRVFQKQTDDKIAFLSCFFFVSVFTFYEEMLALTRQQIAELIFVLLILLMIDKDMNKIRRSLLFIVFGISLIVSHYGLSYIYMGCLIMGLLLVFAAKTGMQSWWNNLHSKSSRTRDNPALVWNPNSFKIEVRTVSTTFVLLFIIFAVMWYMYVSSSSAFNAIVRIGAHITSSILTDFLNPEAAQALGIVVGETLSPFYTVLKCLHLLVSFFIIVGIFTILLKRSDMKFENEYIVFSLINMAILLACFALPYFASAINTSRLYHITHFFLAPFCVIGGLTVFRVLISFLKKSWSSQSMSKSLKVFSIFLVVFLLFNSEFVMEVHREISDDDSYYANSFSLSQPRLIEGKGTPEEVAGFYGGYTSEFDVYGAKWLSNHKGNRTIVHDYSLLLLSQGMIPGGGMECQDFDFYNKAIQDIEFIREKCYIFLREPNIRHNMMVGFGGEYWNTSEIRPILEKNNEIYSNGGSEIYT